MNSYKGFGELYVLVFATILRSKKLYSLVKTDCTEKTHKTNLG